MSNLKKLQQKWYKKLKASGFEDIEQSDGNLKYWDSQYFQNRKSKTEGPVSARPKNPERDDVQNRPDFVFFKQKQDYFYKATHFLEEYPFESKIERKFWELHVQGKSNREIEKILKIKRRDLSEIMHCLIKAMEKWKQS